MEELPQYFPGSTGARFRGGWEGFLSDAVEGAGASAPQAILIAGTTGSATPFVAGSATALQMGETGRNGAGCNS